MLKTLSKLNTCVYYWNSVENTPNNYGKRFPPLLRVFPATPTVVNNSVGNGFYDAFPGNSSTQNELKIKKSKFLEHFSTSARNLLGLAFVQFCLNTFLPGNTVFDG